ncbi:hypothetical protein D3C73_1223660 [compost metagenome]
MHDVAAHLFQHRLERGEQFSAGADHEGQCAGRRAAGAAGNRRIAHVHAFGRSGLGHLARSLRIDGAAVHGRCARAHARQHAVVVQVDTAHMGCGRQHGDHQFAVGCRFLGRGADLPAQFGELGQYGLVQVEQVQLVPGLDQVAGHGGAHVAQADECDTHGDLLSAG